MRYIIMAGRNIQSETHSDIPKQLWKVGYETVIGRTIRLLRKCGVKNIAISTNDDQFKRYGLKLLKHHNEGPWINAFYPTDEPTCYICGDVVFSMEAVQTIVNTETDSIEFFASAPPFSKDYPKRWAEPFAFKVVDTKYFRECINTVRKGINDKIWKRDPIAWELWQVIKKTSINKIDYTNYTIINDFTCDVDTLDDLRYYENMERLEGPLVGKPANYMIHACPQRRWYVDEYLIPSMLKQGIKEEQIVVWCDDYKMGNLRACMESFLTLPDDGNGTWHLQDDVIICKDFKERTAKHNSGFVAGFISQRYDADTMFGVVKISNIPWTFPCIRIPNKVARQCAEWTLQYIIGNPVYLEQTKGGNGDDWVFKLYLQSFLKDKMVHNLKPSLVDHIDWLIGGSAVGSKRTEPTRARYFDDLDLVEKLEKQLCKKKR